MARVVLDTDVASLIYKGRLPAALAARRDECPRHDEDHLAGPTMSWANLVASASSPDKV